MMKCFLKACGLVFVIFQIGFFILGLYTALIDPEGWAYPAIIHALAVMLNFDAQLWPGLIPLIVFMGLIVCFGIRLARSIRSSF
jgi:hypothetical protein